MMLTRCPKCTTAFRVSVEQLKLKQGKVRCGQCLEVFNALSTLVDEPDPAAVPAPDENLPEPAHEAAEAVEALAEPPEEEASAEDAEEPAEIPATITEPPEEESEPEPVVWPSYLDDVQLPGAAVAAPRWVWLWSALTLLAALLLALQALVHYRVELAVAAPTLKPILRQAYGWFGVDLPLPRKAELLAIEHSDLHPGNSGQLLLSATLKNRAGYALAYPDIELTLTDLGDQALLRKVIAPADYLPPGMDADAGFEGNAELAFNLTLETGVTGAAGYRIYLFYP